MTYNVFISSSMDDMHLVQELRKMLEQYGIHAVIPVEEAITTTAFTEKIKQLIQSSDCVLVIIGKGGRRSRNVDFEVGIATAQNKLIIPLIEEGAEKPNILLNKMYIVIDKNKPQLSYESAAKYLSKQKIEKENRDTLGGLLLLGLGILILGALLSGD